jgi:uncharacterized membrane protein YedE/YeeE
MTRTHQALGLQPATLFAAGELGALPFALSDVGWLLIGAALMLVVVMGIGAIGRRRRRVRALNAVQRGTSGT